MIYNYENDIYAVDAYYEGEETAAVYILYSEGEAAIIDTAHNDALPHVLDAVAELGIDKTAVRYIFLTHVHLDHAGGAGRFMQAFPNARLVVHPRGARHMIAPEKLVAGVNQVYGEAETKRMYGEIVPVPEDRVIAPQDGDVFEVGSHKITALDTPGHARHHLAFYDDRAAAVFTGDSFGMSYRGLGKDGTEGIIPTTSPVQFDPEAMRESMKKILALKPEKLYPSHFGELRGIARITDDLHRQIDAYVALAIEAKGDYDKIRAGLQRIFEEEGARQGWAMSPSEIERRLSPAIDLNAQGLAFWYDSTHKPK